MKLNKTNMEFAYIFGQIVSAVHNNCGADVIQHIYRPIVDNKGNDFLIHITKNSRYSFLIPTLSEITPKLMTNKYGLTALHYAKTKSQFEYIMENLSIDKCVDYYTKAIIEGNLDRVELLLRHKFQFSLEHIRMCASKYHKSNEPKYLTMVKLFVRNQCHDHFSNDINPNIHRWLVKISLLHPNLFDMISHLHYFDSNHIQYNKYRPLLIQQYTLKSFLLQNKSASQHCRVFHRLEENKMMPPECQYLDFFNFTIKLNSCAGIQFSEYQWYPTMKPKYYSVKKLSSNWDIISCLSNKYDVLKAFSFSDTLELIVPNYRNKTKKPEINTRQFYQLTYVIDYYMFHKISHTTISTVLMYLRNKSIIEYHMKESRYKHRLPTTLWWTAHLGLSKNFTKFLLSVGYISHGSLFKYITHQHDDLKVEWFHYLSALNTDIQNISEFYTSFTMSTFNLLCDIFEHYNTSIIIDRLNVNLNRQSYYGIRCISQALHRGWKICLQSLQETTSDLMRVCVMNNSFSHHISEDDYLDFCDSKPNDECVEILNIHMCRQLLNTYMIPVLTEIVMKYLLS